MAVVVSIAVVAAAAARDRAGNARRLRYIRPYIQPWFVNYLVRKLTTRLGPYWLLLEASGDSTWRLQLLGDNHHEAEITAVDEEEAKDAAVVATVALLKEENPEFKEPAKVQWNPAFVSDNRFNL